MREATTIGVELRDKAALVTGASSGMGDVTPVEGSRVCESL